ncbi:MAG TPA: exodeoxyribonuclease VII small subunit [Nitrospirales bacterium]|nr:exodeoxyribonuclease VII small subunit [Nitrospirales bacterium]
MAVRKFEAALARLEVIVADLEQGELPMDASLKIFEEGVRLSKQCMKMLEDAEKKVEVLLEDTDGKIRPRPFPIDSEHANHGTVIDEAASTILDEEH